MPNTQYIKQLRVSKGYSQEELSRKLNVSRQKVSAWECGNANISEEDMLELSNFYDIPFERFKTAFLNDNFNEHYLNDEAVCKNSANESGCGDLNDEYMNGENGSERNFKDCHSKCESCYRCYAHQNKTLNPVVKTGIIAGACTLLAYVLIYCVIFGFIIPSIKPINTSTTMATIVNTEQLFALATFFFIIFVGISMLAHLIIRKIIKVRRNKYE